MQEPIITIFCSFTRDWAVEPWLNGLAQTHHDPALTNVAIIVDTYNDSLANKLRTYFEAHRYRSFHVIINRDWEPNEMKQRIRRPRIAQIKNQSKELIARTDGTIIIGLEDDTILDRAESFEYLIGPILEDDKVGFVQGVQMGRHGTNMVGVWDCDDYEYPQEVWTLLPPGDNYKENMVRGYQEITGGGFYGYATQRELYLAHDYYWATSQPWGPDVNYGFWLKQRGYKCLVNWDVLFGHSDHNDVCYPDNPPRGGLVKIVYNRDKLTGKWERRDYEQSN